MLLFSLFWLLLLLAGTLYLLWCAPTLMVPKHAVWILLGIAFLARLLPNALLADISNYDIDSFYLAGEALSRGENVYLNETTQNRHPYLPFQLYLLETAYKVANQLGWPFPFTVRLLPLSIDAILAAGLFLTLNRNFAEATAFRWGLIYALNPVTILVSACHGQFDALPTALTLAALLAVPHSIWKSGLFLGFGVLSKSWPVLAWPQIMAFLPTWKKRVVVTILMVAIPLIAVCFYAWIYEADPMLSLRKAVTYNWGTGIWGYTYFLRMALMRLPGWPQTWAWFLNVSRFLTLGVLGWFWFSHTRFQSPVRGFLGTLLVFFAWGHAFSIQYLLWPVAFAVYLQDQKWVARYILGASAYMFLAYYTLIFQNVITRLLPWPQADWYVIMLAGVPAWLVTVFWLRASLRKS